MRYRSRDPRPCDIRTTVRYCSSSVLYSCRVRSAISTACARFSGSLTTNCARAGATIVMSNRAATVMRFNGGLSVFEGWRDRRRHYAVRGEVEVRRQIHLDPMPFTNGDGWQTVEKPVHCLCRGLGGGFGAAGDHHRSVTGAVIET